MSEVLVRDRAYRGGLRAGELESRAAHDFDQGVDQPGTGPVRCALYLCREKPFRFTEILGLHESLEIIPKFRQDILAN